MVAHVDADDAPTVLQATRVLSLRRDRIEVVGEARGSPSPAASRPSTPRTDASARRPWPAHALGSQARPKRGRTSKNARCTVVVMCTLQRRASELLSPKNERVHVSFGPKALAFQRAKRHAARRGFGPDLSPRVQVVTCGDDDRATETWGYLPGTVPSDARPLGVTRGRVSNRSRRERRAAQAQRALDAEDPKAFEALSATNPETAAQHVARALSSLPVDRASPLDGVAADLCARLRRSGRLPAARRLAGACAHRSTRLRLENALAAFALGEDDEAERAASADPRVAAVLAPLLDAARTVPAREAPPSPGAAPSPKQPEKKPRQPRDPRPPALRALQGVAAAAKAAVLGQIGPARAALRGLPAAAKQSTVLMGEMSAAIDLAKASGPSLGRAADRLIQSPVVRASAPAREALVHALAGTDVKAALAVAKRLGLPDEALRPLQIRALAGTGKVHGASTVQAALELAGAAGADIFDAPQRATACLYEGFACLQSDPKRAGRAFDRAIELGGDLLEALRGKLLLAMADIGEPCADCGGHHGSRPEHQGREVGAAADRFARAARRIPSGAPFAVVASLIAAEGWEREGDTKAATAAIDAARAASDGALRDDLDLREAHLLAPERPERASALLDALIASDPGHTRAWRMKIELARDAMDDTRADDLLVRAAIATADPELSAKARGLRIRRGELAPFGGLSPGTATAGALAAEAAALLSVPGERRELPPVALACRAALAPAGQLAFDAALVYVEASTGKGDDAARRLAQLFEVWWGSPKSLAKLAAFTWVLGLSKHLVPAARRLVSRGDAAPATAALFDAAIAAEDADVAEALLKIGAASWSRADIQDCRRQLGRLRDGSADFGSWGPRRPAQPGAVMDPDDAGRDLEAALAPEFRMWRPSDSEDKTDLDDLNVADATQAALELLGLSEGDIRGLTPARMVELLGQVERMSRGAYSPAKLEELRKVARRVARKA